MRRATLVWFSALVTALPTAAFAQNLPCDQLSALSLPRAKVTASHVVAAGAFVGWIVAWAFRGVPASRAKATAAIRFSACRRVMRFVV